MRMDRILRDYRDAGSLNGLFALWGFVDDTTFLTKAGHVGVVYRIHGVDDEGLPHEQRQVLAHRLEAGLRLLDEHCRVYQYLLKRRVPPFVAAPCPQPVAHEAIQRDAALVWLSVSVQQDAKRMRAVISGLARSLKSHNIKLVIGGRYRAEHTPRSEEHVHSMSSMSELSGFAHGIQSR